MRASSTLRVGSQGNPETLTLGDLDGAIDTVTGTTYSIVEADYNRIKDFTNGSAITVTIPVGLPFPFQVGLSQSGAGQITVVAASGVTLNGSGGLVASAAQYDFLTLKAFAANVFRVFGNRS